jgi:predicted ATPase
MKNQRATVMIEKITIKNYKSIRELTDFELKPINILIGANNSGKSNFLDVFAFLRDTLLENSYPVNGKNTNPSWRGAVEKRGGGNAICYDKEQSFQIAFEDQHFRYSLRMNLDQWRLSFQIEVEQLKSLIDPNKRFFEFSQGNVTIFDKSGKEAITQSIDQRTALCHYLQRSRFHNSGDEPASNFAKSLSEIKIYDRIHTEIWSPIRTPQKPKGETILDEDGGNLVDVLHQLSQVQPKFLSELNSLLKILFRDFARISFPSNERGEILIRWEDENGRVSNAAQLSDGTLKLLCLLAILENPNPPPLIGIDEIDANMHPKMWAIVADMLDEVAQRTQVIATTHNPDFVSMFTPEEIVILQQYKGATEMRRFSTKGALELWLKDFGTRELWLMGELESRW